MEGQQLGVATPRNWEDLIAKSNGQMINLPEKFMDSAKEMESLRNEFKKLLETLSEKEIVMNMATQNMFFEIRKYLAGTGMEIWTKDIGFNTEAMKDGKFILNLRETNK